MDKKRAYIFDIDGTLMDSRPAIHRLIRDWFTSHSLPTPSYEQIMQHIHSTDLEGVLVRFLPSDYRKPEALQSVTREVDNLYSHVYLPKYLILINGAVERLTRLQNHGIRIALVTNGTRQMMKQFIRLFKLYSVIDIAISANDVKKPKPDPSGILQALDFLDMEPKYAVFVGDTTTDMRAGEAAGILSIGVLSGIGNEEELLNAGADSVAKSVAEMKQF